MSIGLANYILGRYATRCHVYTDHILLRMARSEGNSSPLRHNNRQPALMLKVGNRVTYPRPHPGSHRSLIDQSSQPIGSSTSLWSTSIASATFASLCPSTSRNSSVNRWHISPSVPSTSAWIRFLGREQTHRNARCLRHRASTHHRRRPTRIGRC